MRSVVLASFSLLVALPAFAAEDEWKQIHEENGIKVWQREVEGSSFVEFRGAAEVKANLRMILAVLHDNDRKTEWLGRCAENRLVRAKKTAGNNVIYNRTRSGVPLIDDRDVVIESFLTVQREQKKVRIDVKNVSDPLAPERDGIVRMPKLTLSWTLEYKNPTTTGVVYQVQADPGGLLPAWIVNLVSKEIPFKTISGLREQVKKPGYDKDLMIVEASYDWSGIE